MDEMIRGNFLAVDFNQESTGEPLLEKILYRAAELIPFKGSRGRQPKGRRTRIVGSIPWACCALKSTQHNPSNLLLFPKAVYEFQNLGCRVSFRIKVCRMFPVVVVNDFEPLSLFIR